MFWGALSWRRQSQCLFETSSRGPYTSVFPAHTRHLSGAHRPSLNTPPWPHFDRPDHLSPTVRAPMEEQQRGRKGTSTSQVTSSFRAHPAFASASVPPFLCLLQRWQGSALCPRPVLPSSDRGRQLGENPENSCPHHLAVLSPLGVNFRGKPDLMGGV